MPTMIDRMTVNWQGQHELMEADKFRKIVGARAINRTIKQLIREFMLKGERP